MHKETQWALFAGATTLLASVASRRALAARWPESDATAPPNDPELEDTSMVRALAWSMAVAGTAGIARLVARRAAAGAWRKMTSEAPPGTA